MLDALSLFIYIQVLNYFTKQLVKYLQIHSWTLNFEVKICCSVLYFPSILTSVRSKKYNSILICSDKIQSHSQQSSKNVTQLMTRT